jgi:hypothetical protein
MGEFLSHFELKGPINTCPIVSRSGDVDILRIKVADGISVGVIHGNTF